MCSIVSKIYDEIMLHGSWEAYCKWRDREELPYFQAPEAVDSKNEEEFDIGIMAGLKKVRYICDDEIQSYNQANYAHDDVGNTEPHAVPGDDGRG